METDNTQAQLLAAFHQLPLLENKEAELQIIISFLMNVYAATPLNKLPLDGAPMGVTSPRGVPPHFAKAGPQKTRKEIETLIRLLNRRPRPEPRILCHIETLHQSSIITLANMGYPTLRLDPFADEKPLTITLKNEDLAWLKPIRFGRHKDIKSLGVSKMLAHYFKILTGKKPTIIVDYRKVGNPAKGAYFELTKTVFSILNICASPECFAKMAIRSPKASKGKK